MIYIQGMSNWTLNFGLVFETALAWFMCYCPGLDNGLRMYGLRWEYLSTQIFYGSFSHLKLAFFPYPTLLERYFQVNWLSDSHGGSAAFHSRFWSSSTTRRVVISSENTQADGSKGKRTTKSHNYLNIITSFELSKFVICAVCISLKISLHCELLQSFIL